MKKIISTVLAIALILTMVNIPVVSADASADLYSVVIEDDLSNYTSIEEMVNWYQVKEGTTADVEIANGGLEIRQVSPKLLNSAGTKKNSSFSPELKKFLKTEMVDEENNTVVTLEKMQGIIDINIDYSTKVVFPDPVGDFTFGSEYYRILIGSTETVGELLGSDNSAVQLRMMKDLVNPVLAKGIYYSENSGENHTIKVSLDTINKQASVLLDGDTDNERSGSFSADIDSINSISFSGLERLGEGSYFRIENIKVNKKESAAETETLGVVNSLPESLVDDYSNVVANISIPEDTEYVKWSTSDETVISADGVVTRGTEDKEVKIIATVDLGNHGGVYTKTYVLNVPKAGNPVEDDEEDDEDEESNLFVIEEDFTKYSDINDVPNFVFDKDTHATVKAVKGEGIVVSHHKSTPLVNGSSSNVAASPELAYMAEARFNEDSSNRTSYRINRFNGKYRISMEYMATCEPYPDGKYEGVAVSVPYYSLTLGQVSSVEEMVSTISTTGLYFRIYNGKATVLNSGSASSNTISPKSFSYDEGVTKITIDVDTNSGDSSIMFNDNNKTVGKGPIAKAGYLNAFSLRGQERMLVGSEFVIKNIKFEQLEEDEETNIAIAALDKLPASLVADPLAVTDNVVLPEYENITWSTSDSSIMDENGVINRKKDDTDVIVTATYEKGDVVLHKDYILTVKKGDNVVDDDEETKLIVIEEDFTKYSNINDVPNFVVGKDTHATVKAVKGKGIVVSHHKSTPLAGEDSVNTDPSPEIAHVVEGTFNEDSSNRTAYRINRFNGKYRISMEYTATCEPYPDGLYGDIPISTPFYTLTLGQVNSVEEMTSTISATGLHFRVYNGKATVLNSSSASANTISPKSFSYGDGVAKFVVDVDTISRDSSIICNDNNKTVGKGPIIKAGYLNAVSLKGLQRMLVGTEFVFKSIKFEQLEEDEETSIAIAALDELPDSLVADPFAVTDNVVLPEYEDITWSTSDSKIMDKNGVITRWYDDRDVVVTATYAKGNVALRKEYTLTVKKLDSFYSKELLNCSGNEFEGIITSGDAVIGKTEVSDKGITVSKVTDGNENVNEEQPAYYMDYRIFGEEKPYDSSTKSKVSTSGYSGIYDVSFDITPSVNGDKPVYVSVGKNISQFEQIAALRLMKDEIGIVYNGITTRVLDEVINDKTYNICFRIDTDTKKVWLLVNGNLVTKDLTFDDVDIIDTLRVILDKNNFNGDNVVINNIVLRELEKIDIEDKTLLVKALDKIEVTDITAAPDNAVSLKQLPATVDGYSIKWSSNSSQVDVDNFSVYRGESDKDVIVTAMINKGSVYAKKLFYINVPKADSVLEMIEHYISDLDETITKQNPDDIRYDINLPTQHNGLNIEWVESSAPGVLNTDGKINKSVAIVDAVDVALKAKITYGGETVYKTYNYKVSPRAYERVVYTGTNAPESITINGVDDIVITRDSVTDIKFTQNGNGVITFADSYGKKIATVNINNDKLNVAYSDTVSADYSIPKGTTVNLKLMVMPEIDRIAVWLDDTIIVDFGETFEEISDLTSVTVSNDVISVSETKITTDEYGVLDINLSNVAYFAPFAKNVVKEDVGFVTDTVISANVEWSSSDEVLINPINGKVHLPDTYEFATMTLTLTSDTDETVKRIVSKKIAIACSDDKNLALNKTVTTSVMEEPGYNKKYITDGNLNTSYGTVYVSKKPVITIDLGKKTYFNTLYVNEDFSKYVNGLKSYTVAYSDDAENWTTVKTGTFSNEESYVVEFDTVFARYISFTVEESEAEELYLNELEVYLFATSYELMKIDVDAIDLNLGYSVVNDIDLPVKGQFGTYFTWKSSHPDIISADGKVTRPSENTTVTLTVTGEYNGETYSKEFSAYVPAKSTTGAKPVGGSGGSGGGGGGGYTGTTTGTSEIPGFVQTDIVENKEEIKADSIFADMDSTHWAYENVKTLKELGIVDGDDKGNFNPSNPVTREQFLKMLVEAVDVPVEFGHTQFNDVDETAWYAPYVSAGVKAGFVNGVSEEAFGVGTEIARQDMALMILRVMNSKNIQIKLSEGIFADDTNISDYAKIAVYAVRSSGIIEGYENMFNPKNSLTRAEAATVIVKLLDVLQEDGE